MAPHSTHLLLRQRCDFSIHFKSILKTREARSARREALPTSHGYGVCETTRGRLRLYKLSFPRCPIRRSKRANERTSYRYAEVQLPRQKNQTGVSILREMFAFRTARNAWFPILATRLHVLSIRLANVEQAHSRPIKVLYHLVRMLR